MSCWRTHATGPKVVRPAGRGRAWSWLAALAAFVANSVVVESAEPPAAAKFRKEIRPLLAKYCSDCHFDGAKKGDVEFDKLTPTEAASGKHDLWLAVLKNVRAGVMPPEKKPRPTPAEQRQLEEWIKYGAFGIDPKDPDPGRVTVRRLNRTEYRNTIRDLIGVDFNTEAEFPADDSGHGFDNISDVLTLSPMLLEKYFDAAKAIVAKAVPVTSGVPAEKVLEGKSFRRADAGATNAMAALPQFSSSLPLSYYQAAAATNSFHAQHAGRYQVVVNLTASERYVEAQFDYNKCRLVFKVDGQELLQREFTREGGKPFQFEFDRDWQPGAHELAFEVQPLTPGERQVRSLTLRIESVTLRGPMDAKHFVRPRNYGKFFPKGDPKSEAGRRQYARELLAGFATRAFRRPVDDRIADRLAALAEGVWKQPGKTFEAGVAHGMVAVLASPRFLFREEAVEGAARGRPSATGGHPLVDEFALASRLSYFLWSSMPDEELFRLAREKQLRKNVPAQVQRMLADPRSRALVENFTGQWLQARDIETVEIDARSVLGRETGAPVMAAAPSPEVERARNRFRELRNKPPESLTPAEKEELEKARAEFFRSFGANRGGPRAELTPELRRAMRQETEKSFDHIVRNDRSVLELIDCDYAFLNEALARHYGLTNVSVSGPELRLVKLPPDSPRGGVLTQGTLLAVTSNPTRTSPVKRGVFILENILGLPPSPPPPDIPTLEDVAKEFKGRTPTLRETLALHREKPLCSSCHNRMDPLGLALENFNAMGMWRDKELGQPVESAGRLITGEEFTDIRGLKRVLATRHQRDIYVTLTEKLLTYALGRGLDHRDVETVDRIVTRLERDNGRFSALLTGIVESAPFQKRREVPAAAKPVEAPPKQVGKNSEE